MPTRRGFSGQNTFSGPVGPEYSEEFLYPFALGFV